MIAAPLRRSPLDGTALHADTPHSLSDGTLRWPVIESIPYLRTGRETLASATLEALDTGDNIEALALLLGDRDDWDRSSPPSRDALRSLARDADQMTFRDAMQALAFGDVGTYFTHRWSDPTFVAGLGLLAAHRPLGGRRSFELACGAGHYLRELLRAGVSAEGGDVVFSKLWLARRFIAPVARLVCFDAASPWPIASAAYDLVHVHDALYFLPDKPHVARELRRIVQPSGTIAISHTHNAAVDNLSAGEPLTLAGYTGLFPDAVAYDDSALAAAVIAGNAPQPGTQGELARAAAFAFASDRAHNAPRIAGGDVALPNAGTMLTRNPLYAARGGTHIAWPSLRYEREYAALATYPAVTAAPPQATMSADRAIVSFARTRELVALPERW